MRNLDDIILENIDYKKAAEDFKTWSKNESSDFEGLDFQ
jgi:hypothetical protein